MSVQWETDASQNLTCPVVTAEVPASTVAFSVVTVPDATVLTVPSLDETARFVVVGVEAAQHQSVPRQKTVARAANM